jgi:hypothetical protein
VCLSRRVRRGSKESIIRLPTEKGVGVHRRFLPPLLPCIIYTFTTGIHVYYYSLVLLD